MESGAWAAPTFGSEELVEVLALFEHEPPEELVRNDGGRVHERRSRKHGQYAQGDGQ